MTLSLVILNTKYLIMNNLLVKRRIRSTYQTAAESRQRRKPQLGLFFIFMFMLRECFYAVRTDASPA